MTPAWIFALAAPAALAWGVIAALRASAWSGALADHPNERSLHTRPTPRIGGVGLLAAALPCMAWLGPPPLMPTLAAASALALVSFADDVRSLPIAARLAAHGAAAVAAYLSIASVPASAAEWLAAGAAVLAVAWMTNLYNFMDGADGLAGGMAGIGFGTLALGAAQAGDGPLALACTALASASLGFLAHNFPPARVFMGDAGAIPLGFLAAALGLYGLRSGAWPPEFPLLAFSPFIVDASVTLLRRIARGEPFWKAHRGHHYQRLVLAGWPRLRLALAAYGLMLAAGISALGGRTADAMTRSVIILGWAALYAVLLMAINRSVRRSAAASTTTPRG